MPSVKFTGIIRSFNPRDDGGIGLGIEEQNCTEAARLAVHDAVRDFNPGKTQDFGARDTPCAIKPGQGLYYAVISPDRTEFEVGVTVEVLLEVYMIRRVRYVRSRTGKGRWSSFPELEYSISDIKVFNGSRGVHGAAGADSVSGAKDKK